MSFFGDEDRKKERNSPARGSDIRCFYRVVKDYSMRYPLRMTVFSEKGRRYNVCISKGICSLDGEELPENEARIVVARCRKNFEPLFVRAARKEGIDTDILRQINMADLADMAGKKKAFAKMVLKDSDGIKRKLEIGLKDDAPVFRVDGADVSSEYAENLIKNDYVTFLIQKKKTGDMIGTVPAVRKKETEQRSGRVKVDKEGRITIDLNDYITHQKRKHNGSPGRIKVEKILKKKERGWLEEDNK